MSALLYLRQNPKEGERFARRVRLPFRVEQDRIAARYENGVLWVDLPRAEAERAKKITVHNPS